jgi:hypothetical protein
VRRRMRWGRDHKKPGSDRSIRHSLCLHSLIMMNARLRLCASNHEAAVHEQVARSNDLNANSGDSKARFETKTRNFDHGGKRFES